MEKEIRQPIVTVAGHVDHGKTSILDAIRKTKIVEKEPGAITQKISFSIVPKTYIINLCKDLLEKFKINIVVPGFLFIDTPGHAAFTNLRQRGGSIADLAILVIDLNEGLKEQTRETIEILKQNKTPFIVALNKIDKIPGWQIKETPVFESIIQQSKFTQQEFYNKVSNLISAFSFMGFDAELYWQIKDFTKTLALIPCSAKTGEGLAELLVMLAGLAQGFLIDKLYLSQEAKGNILEIVKEKGFTYYDCILYDGYLNKNDYLLIAGFEKTILARIRALFEALPLGKGFKQANQIKAANGFRISLALSESEAKEVFAGMPFIVLKEKELKDLETIEKKKYELQGVVQNILKLDGKGIIVKADSLGSLEALIGLLRKNGIQIKKAGIGNITKTDLTFALANLQYDPLNTAIIGFQVEIEKEIEAESERGKIAIFRGDIIYKLIEDFFKWREAKELEIEREKLKSLTFPCKIKILKQFIFRKAKPAICGIKILAGVLKKDIGLINREGKLVARVKSIQKENKAVNEAKKGEEVAIALPDVTIGRQVKPDEELLSDLSENEFKQLKANKQLLTQDELKILEEIVEIKRKQKATWGV